MFNNLKPMSATINDAADDQNATKHSTHRLHFKGKPVLSWIKYSTNNNNTQILKPNLNSDQLNNNTTINKTENSSQPELRGVQHLRQLWNSRIGALRDSKSSGRTELNSAKSCGNLLQEDKPSPVVKKALSINNFVEIKSSNTLPKSTKDNFYKYKTAATTEKYRSASFSPDSTPTHHSTVRLNFNFPMIGASARGEKIHWMRRDDVIVRRKLSTEETDILSPDTDVKMNAKMSSQSSEASPASPEIMCQFNTTPAQAFISGDYNSTECERLSRDTQLVIGSSNSLRSLESTTTRKRNANSNRKYSFKTQAKSYHSPRKMPYHAASTPSNKVATLTQQFNEIIQKDRKILDEVKRNNGILISRGGHVYKVIDNSRQSMTATTDAVLPTTKNTNLPLKTNSTVQRAIKRFESKTSDKPKVPVKSAQVLRKRKELTIRNERKNEANPVVLPATKEKYKESLEKCNEENAKRIHVPILKELNENCKKNSQMIETICNSINDRDKLKYVENTNDKNTVNVPQERPSDNEKSDLAGKTKYSMIYERLRFRKTLRMKEQIDAKPNNVDTRKSEIELFLDEAKTESEKVSSSERKQNSSSTVEVTTRDSKCIIKAAKYQSEEDSKAPSNTQSEMVSTEEILNQSSEAKIQRLDSTHDTVEPSVEFTNSFSKETDFEIKTASKSSLDIEFQTEQGSGNNEEILEQSAAEQKILSAIKEVNRRIESLSWKTEDRFGLEYPLNESFLYQDKGKEIALTEAVNTSLINFTESRTTNECKPVSVDYSEQGQTASESVVTKYKEDSVYEGISKNTDVITSSSQTLIKPRKSFLFYNTCNVNSYEGIKETQTTQPKINEKNYESISNTTEVNSYESLTDSQTTHSEVFKLSKNYESINESETKKLSCDYGYEVYETPERILPPRPPKDPSELQRNTTDKLPELPKPKRIIPKKNFASLHTADILAQQHDSDSTVEDDNIYDTIKGGHHKYETLLSSRDKHSDTISLTSNGYESINAFRRPTTLFNAESSSTISSDHKTNSLYEVSFVNGMLTSFQNYSHSYIASSENSDDWVDISDSEVNTYDRIDKKQFIVVRERMKCHRSPDWSKRVREQRLHQTINDEVCNSKNEFNRYEMDLCNIGTIKTVPRQRRPRAVGEVYITSPSSSVYLNSEISEDNVLNEPIYQNTAIEQLNRKINRQRNKFSAFRVETQFGNESHATLVTFVDDVDHYYEPLFPVGNYTKDKTSTPQSDKDSQYAVNNSHVTEDYDSFDTDDDIYENDESIKKNDSGLDISNVRLPNPPPSRNQVYAFVKKVKNFISNKKSPSDPNKNLADSVQAKMYENTQFQVEDNEYQSTLKPTRRAPDKPKTPKIKIKSFVDGTVSKVYSKDENIYENTDFHNPNLKTSSQLNTDNVVQLSTSEKNLIAANDIAVRSKSKTGKSFKSRLKSFGATGLENKQLSTLTTARSTFYVSETSNEQDSGIFEKTSSSDIVAEKPKLDLDDKPVAAVRKNKKDVNANSYRRRTTIGIRPNDPPPPPPTLADDNKKPKQRLSTTSWYTECGLFNIDNNTGVDDNSLEKQTLNLSKSTSNTSWYAEAGLYQTSGVSVASSSGSSGVSTGNEGITGDEIGHHVFLNEPLYQIYNAEKLESISRDLEDRESTDGYEEIGGRAPDNERIKRTRPTALQLVGPKSGPSRTLWSEIPEVIVSEILQTLTPRERSLQEAKFEIITSEASYLKSLNLLRSHFMNDSNFHDTTILNSRDRKTLFSYIVPVHECSEKLLSELENCWQDNIMLLGLSKRIYECAEKNFHVYISYCEHQGKMDRALRRLKEAKGPFCQKLDILETDAICCGLTLHSFLMLPMQRITRLPLLIDAVFSKVHPNDDEYESWKLTLAILNKIVAQCNEAANRCEQAYEIEKISRQLEFPSHIRALAIAPMGVAAIGSKPRFLVKKGEFVHLIWRGDDAKLTFGKKFTKTNIYAFLFSDLMVLTKRKNEEQFTVFDYCPRNMLTISSGDSIPQLPTKEASQTGKNLILMTLLENHERKTIELVLSCPSVSEMERWLQATRPLEAETPGERLYEQWDCPQVIAKHEFIANEPDLLGLEVGDVINVSRKLPDGWFNGERIRDGAIGWFPGNFTEEVNSAHVRARNLKQRYRLLTFTATYLESQKRK